MGSDRTDRVVAMAPTAAPSQAIARSVQLDHPARRDEVVTSRDLVVRGWVARSVGYVRILLESRGGKPIASQAIDPIGMPRGDRIPFESRFRIAMPRPTGPLFVTVIALGRDGTPIDATRRRFQLGTVIEIPGRTGR